MQVFFVWRFLYASCGNRSPAAEHHPHRESPPPPFLRFAWHSPASHFGGDIRTVARLLCVFGSHLFSLHRPPSRSSVPICATAIEFTIRAGWRCFWFAQHITCTRGQPTGWQLRANQVSNAFSWGDIVPVAAAHNAGLQHRRQ